MYSVTVRPNGWTNLHVLHVGSCFLFAHSLLWGLSLCRSIFYSGRSAAALSNVTALLVITGKHNWNKRRKTWWNMHLSFSPGYTAERRSAGVEALGFKHVNVACFLLTLSCAAILHKIVFIKQHAKLNRYDMLLTERSESFAATSKSTHWVR